MKDRVYNVEDLSDFSTYKDPELNKIIVNHYLYYNKLLFNALITIHKRTNDTKVKKFSEKILDQCSKQWQETN